MVVPAVVLVTAEIVFSVFNTWLACELHFKRAKTRCC